MGPADPPAAVSTVARTLFCILRGSGPRQGRSGRRERHRRESPWRRTRSSTRSPRSPGTTWPTSPCCSTGWSARAPAGREPEVRELGRLAGTEQAQEWGRLANEHPPVLRTHDRYGHRIDEVEFHPAWHELMTVAVTHGLHAAPWADTRPGAHVARAAKFYAWRVDAGHGCPISMTYAAVPALRKAPGAGRAVRTAARRAGLRPRAAAAADEERGLLAGMSMTEKQGGSDVRANTTAATPQPDGTYRLVGHKWFTSAPMCDVFLDAGPGPGRPHLLPGPPRPAGRGAEPDAADAPQGQARQQVERVLGGGVRERGRLAGRRRGPRRPHHHRDGQPDPAGLRDRRGVRDAARRHDRRPPRRAPQGVRRVPHRPAADAQRPRGPGGRVGGRHDR